MFEKINKEILEQTINLKGIGDENKSFFTKEDKLPEIQEKGIFSLCKILSDPKQKFAYLADEVGLGKTYQAMGVISMLLREKKGQAKILIITPNATVQKNWERELYLFSENNLVNQQQKLFYKEDIKNFGNSEHALKEENRKNYRERLELKNAIESINGDYWKKINLIKISSFTSYADLFEKNPKKVNKKVQYNLEVLFKGLHLNVTESIRGKSVETQKAGMICAAYYNFKRTPEFDLIVIDEAQNMRNRNNYTTFFNYWLGLYRWKEQPEYAKFGNPILLDKQKTKYLLLSATPTHRSKQTLKDVVDFFVSDKNELENLHHNNIQKFLIRRLRTFEGEKTKYDVRKQKGINVLVNKKTPAEQLEEKLMIAIVQSKLAQIEGGKSNSIFKTGFLECFESYTPSNEKKVKENNTEAPEEKKKGPFDREKGNAPDKRIMADISKKYLKIMGRKVPHPKFSHVEKEISELLEEPNPEKCVIFVRRLASVRELQRRIIEVYEQNVFDYWFNRKDSNNQSLKIKKPTLEALQVFFESKYPRNQNLEQEENTGDDDSELEEKKNDEDDDEKIVSEFMTWIAQKKKNKSKNTFENQSEDMKYSEVSKFKLSMANNKMNSYLFDENYFRSRFYKHNDAAYFNEINSLFSGNFLKKLNAYISSNPEELFFTKNDAQKRSNISALINALALKEKGLNKEADEIMAFYNIPLNAKEGTGRLFSETEVHNYLTQTSLWNVFISEEKVPQLCSDAIPFYEREILKIISEKAIKGSEYILELLWAYCTEAKFGKDKRTILNPNEVVNKSVINLSQNPKFLKKINDLFNNADAVYKHSFGAESKIIPRVQLMRTNLAAFNDQDWVKGATGQGGNKDNEALIKRFNTPFYPDVIVCTDVLKEGINLHLFCNRIIHYGLAWTSGDLEQRVGRVDRFNSKIYRERNYQNLDSKIQVEYPYMGKTIDETQLKNVLIQKTNNDVLMDTEDADEDRFIKYDKEDFRTVNQILEYFEEEFKVSTSPYEGKQFWENQGW